MKMKAICILFLSISIWEIVSGLDFPTAFGMVIKKLEKFKSNGTSLEDAKEYANDFGAANDALAVFRNGTCKVLEELDVTLLDQHYILKQKIWYENIEELKQVTRNAKVEDEYSEWLKKMNIIGSNFEKYQIRTISTKNKNLLKQIYEKLTNEVKKIRRKPQQIELRIGEVCDLYFRGYLILGDTGDLFFEVAFIYLHDEIKNLVGAGEPEILFIGAPNDVLTQDCERKNWIIKPVSQNNIGEYVDFSLTTLNTSMETSGGNYKQVSRGMCNLYYNIFHSSYKNANGNYEKIKDLYKQYESQYENEKDHEFHKIVSMGHEIFLRMTGTPSPSR